jgi:hypothetical protein
MLLNEIINGLNLTDVELGQVVTVVAAATLGNGATQLVYRTADATRQLAYRLYTPVNTQAGPKTPAPTTRSSPIGPPSKPPPPECRSHNKLHSLSEILSKFRRGCTDEQS